jgi:hypothetical protein
VLVELAFEIPSKNRMTAKFVNNVNNLEYTQQNYTMENTLPSHKQFSGHCVAVFTTAGDPFANA